MEDLKHLFWSNISVAILFPFCKYFPQLLSLFAIFLILVFLMCYGILVCRLMLRAFPLLATWVSYLLFNSHTIKCTDLSVQFSEFCQLLIPYLYIATTQIRYRAFPLLEEVLLCTFPVRSFLSPVPSCPLSDFCHHKLALLFILINVLSAFFWHTF